MTADPRAALTTLVAAFERHLEVATTRRDADDEAVVSAAEELTDAFYDYDEALFEATGVTTPLDGPFDDEDEDLDDADDEDDEDDEDDDDFEDDEDDDDFDDDDDEDDDLDEDDLDDPDDDLEGDVIEDEVDAPPPPSGSTR